MADVVSAVQEWLASAPPEVLAALQGDAGGAAHPDHKKPKAEVNYRKMDGASAESCGNCVHYNDGACELVAGNIKDDYVCDLFSPNEETQEPVDTTDEEAVEA